MRTNDAAEAYHSQPINVILMKLWTVPPHVTAQNICAQSTRKVSDLYRNPAPNWWHPPRRIDEHMCSIDESPHTHTQRHTTALVLFDCTEKVFHNNPCLSKKAPSDMNNFIYILTFMFVYRLRNYFIRFTCIWSGISNLRKHNRADPNQASHRTAWSGSALFTKPFKCVFMM